MSRFVHRFRVMRRSAGTHQTKEIRHEAIVTPDDRLWVRSPRFALVALPAVLLRSRTAEAFTLPNLISVDPVSVPVDHTLHVHLVNQFGPATTCIVRRS